MKPEPIHVVAAVIVNKDLILAGRRGAHKINQGFWEFPGGKVEGGETSIQALKREIKEELGLEIIPIRLLSDTITPLNGSTIRLEAHICFLPNENEFVSTDHDQFRWLRVFELHQLIWSEPDLPAVNKLTQYPGTWKALFQNIESEVEGFLL